MSRCTSRPLTRPPDPTRRPRSPSRAPVVLAVAVASALLAGFALAGCGTSRGHGFINDSGEALRVEGETRAGNKVRFTIDADEVIPPRVSAPSYAAFTVYGLDGTERYAFRHRPLSRKFTGSARTFVLTGEGVAPYRVPVTEESIEAAKKRNRGGIRRGSLRRRDRGLAPDPAAAVEAVTPDA